MPDLTPSQVNRINDIAATLADVAPVPLQKWLADFATEADPDATIAEWERYAEVFNRHAKRTDTPKRKQEVLKVCLSFTRFLPSLIKDEKFETLSEVEVDAICADLA